MNKAGYPAAGGVAATIASISVAVGIAFFKLGGLEFLWTGPAAFVTGVVVGSLVSLPPSPDSDVGAARQ